MEMTMEFIRKLPTPQEIKEQYPLSDEIKKVPISEQKLTQMKKLIISAERQNLKTGEYATQDMVKVIRKIIEKNAD